MKFSIKDILSKCYQIHSFLGIWSHWLKKTLMENFIFCAMKNTMTDLIDVVLVFPLLTLSVFHTFY